MTEQEMLKFAQILINAMNEAKKVHKEKKAINVTFIGSVSEPAKKFFESQKYFDGTTVEILANGVAVTVSCAKALKLGTPAKLLNNFLEKQGMLPAFKKFSKESAQVEQSLDKVKYTFTLIKA